MRSFIEKKMDCCDSSTRENVSIGRGLLCRDGIEQVARGDLVETILHRAEHTAQVLYEMLFDARGLCRVKRDGWVSSSSKGSGCDCRFLFAKHQHQHVSTVFQTALLRCTQP
jgi:hypothetical protein